MDISESIKVWPHQSKSSWLHQMIEESQNELIVNQQYTVAEHITGQAYAFYTDLKDEGNILKKSNKVSSWKAGLKIEIKDIGSAKKELDFALSQGVEYIHFLYNTPLYLKDMDFLLDQVYLDLIVSRWDFHTPIDSSSFKAFIESKFSHSVEVFITDAYSPSEDASLTLGTFNIHQWALHLKSMLHDFEKVPKKPKILIFEINFNNDFLLNICSVRALKLVINKLWNTLKINTTPYYEINAEPTCLSQNIHTNLIRLASIALSASIAGPDFIKLPPAIITSDKQDMQWMKSSLHIQHILKQEASMNMLLDAAAGSYFIEDLTEKIAKELWTQLGKLIIA